MNELTKKKNENKQIVERKFNGKDNEINERNEKKKTENNIVRIVIMVAYACK